MSAMTERILAEEQAAGERVAGTWEAAAELALREDAHEGVTAPMRLELEGAVVVITRRSERHRPRPHTASPSTGTRLVFAARAERPLASVADVCGDAIAVPTDVRDEQAVTALQASASVGSTRGSTAQASWPTAASRQFPPTPSARSSRGTCSARSTARVRSSRSSAVSALGC
jgi:hypothetical protein